ncbi:hypothetical protein N3N27_003955 [Escherichia coli]|nr:hypothetical protein [Escherichia coli]EJZ1824553.1 hypothetical protein [Escherichia coli]
MEIRSIEEVSSKWVKKSANAVSPMVYWEQVKTITNGTNRQVLGIVGEWKAIKTRICSKCLDCGNTFEQSLEQVLKGKGCKTCAMSSLHEKLRSNDEDALEKAKEKAKECPVGKTVIGFIGGYKNNGTKNMEVNCKAHGDYITSYAIFVRGGNFACPDCGAERLAKSRKLRLLKTEDALKNLNDRAKEKGRGEIINGIIGGVYTGCHDRNISIKCPSHGDYTTCYQQYTNSPFGCVACANENKGSYRKKTTETALEEARQFAISRGRGEIVKRFEGGYQGYEVRNLVIECKSHGEYVTSLDKFREGCGCTACATWGYDTTRPGYFYLQDLSGVYLKFGITNRDPEIRMQQQTGKSKFDHTMIYTKRFETGRGAFELESKIKKTFPTHAVNKEDMPDGYTETVLIKHKNELLSIIMSQ